MIMSNSCAKIYENPGIHAFGTYEDAEEFAKKQYEPGWIMECPESVGSAYGTGWHFIIGEFDHWCYQGYIPRARVDLVIEINPMFTGANYERS